MWGVFYLIENEIVTIKIGFGLLIFLLGAFLTIQFYLRKKN